MFKRKPVKSDYDRVNQTPVIRVSICSGEQVAGFKDRHTGKFSEVMLIRNDADLAWFLEQYDISGESVKKEY